MTGGRHSLVPTIPHSRPALGRREADAASAVVRSGYVAEGPEARAFEAQFAGKFGIRNAVATSSGTAALHLALRALGVGEKDEVVIPAFVCVALLNAVRYVGATAVFADIDPESYNLDPDDVRRRLTTKTRAVIVPHMFGRAAPLGPIEALGVPVIEDCAQAVGGTCEKQLVGSGHLAIFSFYATKVMTTGEGGMLATDSDGMAASVRDLKEYDQKDRFRLRYNYKMTDMQAAVGRVQLERLDRFLERRRKIAVRYDRALSDRGVAAPGGKPDHIYFRYVIRPRSDVSPFLKAFADRGISCQRPVYLPLDRYFGSASLPATAEAWRRTISVPIYPDMAEEEVERVVSALSDLCGSNL